MAAESAIKFDALEAQARILMDVFVAAGHEAVAPAIIQPADVFLDVIGETLRARTYVFNDPDGAELCLRPDLTVPTCRLHLARHADAATPARYCYNGPAFRFQPQGATAAHPREFRQAGIERFGDAAREVAEAETVATIVKALEAVGYRDWTIRCGDLALFRSILVALQLPQRWQQRLGQSFNNPPAFAVELRRISTAPGARALALPEALTASIVLDDLTASEAAVESYLDANGIELIGTRTAAEIALHIMDVMKDAGARPLDADAANLIASYLSVSGPARTAGARIAGLLAGVRGGPGAALDAFDRRLALLANAGIDLDRVTFAADFGRPLAYYSGFVFDVTGTGISAGSPVAGGGRYDGLLRAAGAAQDVAAVGAAIHTERLLAAIEGATA